MLCQVEDVIPDDEPLLLVLLAAEEPNGRVCRQVSKELGQQLPAETQKLAERWESESERLFQAWHQR
ncbi:hypothetical protein [Streptomyces boninensis]|uniref:hypothetical protein n=1 Tax=Streptomyces boninensis TaxID=2039455 RepID=UPI003B20C525